LRKLTGIFEWDATFPGCFISQYPNAIAVLSHNTGGRCPPETLTPGVASSGGDRRRRQAATGRSTNSSSATFRPWSTRWCGCTR
jgi:hypothetical protein